ncbi:MAG: hypothetical protein ACI8T1_004714 [Verrucomicrobiales bacterium]|jgi:hypothetical protein
MACFPHIRSLFEIDLYLRWIFEANYEDRGTAYFVWNIRRKRYWLRCYLEGTPEFDANKEHMTGPIAESVPIPYSKVQLQETIDHETSRLDLPELKHINEMFEAKVKANGTDGSWHQPLGPS